MTDVLERMRAGNPVPDPGSPAIEPVLDRIEAEARLCAASGASRPAGDTPARSRGLRWRYRVALVGVLLGAGALVLILGHGSRQGLSIVARAYAATDSRSSILYYVTDSSLTAAGHTRDLGRSRAWQFDGRVRERTENASTGVQETVLAPHLFAVYNSANNSIFRVKADFHPLPLKVGTLGPQGYVPVPFENPISQLRGWYSGVRHLRIKRREIIAGVHYDVLSASETSSSGSLRSTRIVIRADDFAPVEVKTTTSVGGRLQLQSVTRYSAFRHLPVNAGTLALLRLAPHPGAKVRIRTVSPKRQTSRSTYSVASSIERRTVITSPTGKVECELTPGSSAHAVCQSFSPKERVTLGLQGSARVCRGGQCVSKMHSTAKRVAFRGTLHLGHHLQCLSGKAVGVLCLDLADGNSFRLSGHALKVKAAPSRVSSDSNNRGASHGVQKP